MYGIIHFMKNIDATSSSPPAGASAEKDKEKLIQHILGLNQRLEELERALRPVIPTEWLSADLTMTQLRVVVVLFREGPVRMSALASSLGLGLATATGVVDRLVDRGYVVREGLPSDRRVVMCRLSAKGEKLMTRLWQAGQDQIRRMLEIMTCSQLEQVAKGTEAFIEAARQLQEESGSRKRAKR
ncbi:MAG: MarR family transcriptional regulator [Chloroflexi bacterium]|nr:MAG: MarR family transcriptional regulator [Chloroflexota bacterium]